MSLIRHTVALISMFSLSAVCSGYESERAAFSLRVNDIEIPYRVFAIYMLPGESIDVRLVDPGQRTDAELITVDGERIADSVGAWQWRAPRNPGLTKLAVSSGAGKIELNVFVMYPASAVTDERLNGFRMGNYPSRPLNGNPLYLPPDGFVELTAANADTLLSPHFRLAQFPSKQAGGYPKYLALREQLLLKLELLLERVNEAGIDADSMTIMSGYRTPFYNAAIGNVPYSRHVFGGAADVFIDVSPADDYMDDLNGDGSLDFRDAQWLYRLADGLFSRNEHRALRGGLGVYRRTSAHGPFLHIDARAQRARWGLLP